MSVAGLKLPSSAGAYLAIGGVVLVLYFVAKREALKGAGAVLNAVNPVSDQNVFYQASNAVGSVLTQDKDFSLGAWIYEKTHPAEVAAEKKAIGAPVSVEDSLAGWGYM